MTKLIHILATTCSLLALVACATGAGAQEATPDHPQPVSSPLTRAEVRAELARAKQDGSMAVYSGTYNALAAARSLRTRAEVQADLLATPRGERAALHGEDSGSFALPQATPRRGATTLAAR